MYLKCRERAVAALAQANSTRLSSVNDAVPAPFLAGLRDTLRLEVGQIGLWSPVLMVTGIWAYFGLVQEPTVLLCGALGGAALLAFALLRTRPIAVALAIVATGFVLAKMRTDFIATALLRAPVLAVQVKGHIVDIDIRSAKRATLVVEVEQILGVPLVEQPRRIRLTAFKFATGLNVGTLVKFSADLSPLPRPVQPGAFEFGRQLFFQSIGAVGRIRGDIEPAAASVPWRFVLRRSFHDLRVSIGERVRATISGPLGHFADAIITGERAAIPPSMTESLQRSGLFHILSISGLHMSLVVGGVFWLFRAVLALIPWLALRYPIKKWAALAGLVAGLFYMLLADSGPATERSYVMVAVMLFAILVDRPGISMRNLALAALIILVFAPEQALAASFQMSFMAVLGIAAFFDWWQRSGIGEPKAGRTWMQQMPRRIGLFVIASLATSVVAGALSSIPAVHHFGRLAPFSVIANALALPVVGIIIMPMALIGTLLLPFGLEYLPYSIMEQGLKVLMQISDWIAAWKWSGMAPPPLGATSAAGLALAAMVFCLGKSWLKWTGLAIAGVAMIAGQMGQAPDVIIEERARNVAVRTETGLLTLALPRATRFATSRWLRAEGDVAEFSAIKVRTGWTCSAVSCLAQVHGKSVIYLLDEAEKNLQCPATDILIAAFPLRRKCRGTSITIDRFDVWREGAISLTYSNGAFAKSNSVMTSTHRPWGYQPRARIKPRG